MTTAPRDRLEVSPAANAGGAVAARPLLVTMGDVCGIGPEIIARAWQHRCLTDTVVLAPDGGPQARTPWIVVGDVGVLRRAARIANSVCPMARIDAPGDIADVPIGTLAVLQPADLPADLLQVPIGQIDARAGRAAAACIREAVRWARSGEGAGVVTAPIHKEAWAAAGIDYPGHTEFLQALAGNDGQAPPVRMMLASAELRVVLVTVHMALRDAIAAIDHDLVLQTLRITHAAGASLGIPQPRIGVAGLNPHAGEGGLFGSEERRIIGPAIEAARQLGIDARGPYAPDTVFMRARHVPGHSGEFDFVVAMTHDHGLIPVKYLGIEHGVNVTLGLPFVRTSPDHGTAFDIAGSGQADPASLCAAIDLAGRLAWGVSRQAPAD